MKQNAIQMKQNAICRGAEKSQQSHKYFLQYSTFAYERSQVPTWGRQTWLLSRALSNLGRRTPNQTNSDVTFTKSCDQGNTTKND